MMIRKLYIKNIELAFLVVVFILGCFTTQAQINNNLLEGEVSYITGQNIYVKFASTQGLETNDTLFISKDGKLIPAMVVKHQSSISCLCNPIGSLQFKVGDKLNGKSRFVQNITNESPTQSPIEPEKDVSEQVLTAETTGKVEKTGNHVSGRLSLSSYSNFSNSNGEDYHRFRYTLSMDALNIGNSRISAETYLSFSHKLNDWAEVQENLNNALKVYNLALKYNINESTEIWAGRKINSKIANVGAIDGIQFQKGWNNYFAGAVAGSRPDFSDYGFNPNLLEYGAYIGQHHKTKNGFVQSSLALFEQRNSGKTDRRFVYFQHTNSFLKNINVFSSFEIDLYKIQNNEPQNTLRLTGLYFSANYRISQKLSLFGSYDNRKNVIYYETFRNYTDEVLQQASRQGLRFRINYKPVKYLNLGFNAGTRFRKEDPRPTNTYRGNATYTRIPFILASFGLSANLMQSAYLDGQVYGARLSKYFLNGKLYSMLNYRNVSFDYHNTSSSLKQNIGEIDLSYQFNKKLYLSVNFETTLQNKILHNRLYFNLRKRF